MRDAARFLGRLAAELQSHGVVLEYLDLGGGLGISYDGAAVLSPVEYVTALVDEVRHTGLPIVIEPGRSIVGPAGALVGSWRFDDRRGTVMKWAALEPSV